MCDDGDNDDDDDEDDVIMLEYLVILFLTFQDYYQWG